jgi:hypothetical protein
MHMRATQANRGPATVALVVSLLVLTSGCGHHRRAAEPPATSSSASSTSASAAALKSLESDAGTARAASFAATYRAQDNARTGTVRVFRTPTKSRLDVETAGASTTVRIIVDSTGTYSCKLGTGTAPLCVTLASPNQQSMPLDPGLQHVFTSAFDLMAAGSGITVAPQVTHEIIAGLSTTCYTVTDSASTTTLSPGQYCFGAAGVLAKAQFRTSSLTLLSLDPAPQAGDFTLPASPAPLQGSSGTSANGSGTGAASSSSPSG